MSPLNEKSFKMKMRDVETALKYRRIPYPKRSVELIALLAISCTFFLFMHTNKLNSRLKEMEVKLQPSEFSALGLTGENHLSGRDAGKPEDINTLHGTYQYLKSTGQLSTLTAEGLNNTRNAEVDVLFFNRVPKVGSETMMALIKLLAQANGFVARRDKPANTETIMVDEQTQLDYADEVLEAPHPATYTKHIAYIDFEELDYPRPIYMNLVRDPVERLVSWFYYVRAPWYIAIRKKSFPNRYRVPSVAWLKKSFDNCVLQHDPECVYAQNEMFKLGDHRRQVLFFCGQDQAICMPFNAQRAMQQAKRHVETQYAVVGSWEDTNITLTVLEHYIPRFFAGATAAYYKEANRLHKVNRNSMRPPVSRAALDLLRRNLTHEIEFYEFCKQRLYKQFIAIRLGQPFNSVMAMQKAKRTVESDYAVVGTFEDTNITLAVFEQYIPRYFRNAKIAYYLGKDRLSKVNKNNLKRPVSDETRAILRANLTHEIEFYEFCKQRLYLQYAAITAHNKIEGDDYLLVPEPTDSNDLDDY